jgi:hypothetical protein
MRIFLQEGSEDRYASKPAVVRKMDPAPERLQSKLGVGMNKPAVP